MVEREGFSVTGEARGTGRPTLEQGCVLSAGAAILFFGGCVAASSLDWELLFLLCTVAGALSALVGLVLLIVRLVRWGGRRG